MSWKVLFTERCESEVKRMFQTGELTEDDRRVIYLWIKQVEREGPYSLREPELEDIWRDHSLNFGPWLGYRASSFSFKGRIIYKIREKRVSIIVVRVTPEHDYKQEN